MLELLDDFQGLSHQKEKICQAFDRARDDIRQDSRQGPIHLVTECEAQVAEHPNQCFIYGPGHDQPVRLQIGANSWQAGRFSCPNIGQLRRKCTPTKGAKLQLFVLEGTASITDVGALQGLAPPKSLFQAASQFNCLESPGPWIVPVSNYLSDPTQGPRASISAFPGTLLRHYGATSPSGERFVQSNQGPQINLLHRVTLPQVAKVDSGYLMTHNISNPQTFSTLLQEHFDEIEVGFHQDVEVILGANWRGFVKGPRYISQVFTSTIAGGGYSRLACDDPLWQEIVRQLQRAAYLGTLLAAAASQQRRVVLTFIGGGVFANPLPIIWESILWACEQVKPHLNQDLTVIVNARSLEGLGQAAVGEQCLLRGGGVIACHPDKTRFLS